MESTKSSKVQKFKGDTFRNVFAHLKSEFLSSASLFKNQKETPIFSPNFCTYFQQQKGIIKGSIYTLLFLKNFIQNKELKYKQK